MGVLVASHIPVPQGDHFWGIGLLICFEVSSKAVVTQFEATVIGQQQI